MTLQEFKQQFDPLFMSHLAHVISRVASTANNPPFLLEAGRTLTALARDGKRIRPFVAYMMVASDDGDLDAHILPLLISLELFHTFALIHDDIIDKDTVRHGIPTLHCKHGSNLALLMGDMCFAFAYDCIVTAEYPEETRELYGRMVQNTITGQMLDVTASFSDNPFLITELKTTEYTFIYPMKLAVSLFSKPLDPRLAHVAKKLGGVFQRLDDLYNVVGATSATGKKPCGDIARGVYTELTQQLLRVVSPPEAAYFMTYFNRSLNDHEILEVQNFFRECGVIANEKEFLRQELCDIHSMLLELCLPQSSYSMFLSLILLMNERVDLVL